MATEIERKFLVEDESWRTDGGIRICQGYLNRDEERTVRVRIAGEKAFITIKGISSGATRAEFEYAIPVEDAAELLKMCDGPLIEKMRHIVIFAGITWEVDEFFGENAGLVVAEVELETEEQTFEMPEWLGAEVTEDVRYYNANLAVQPYASWGG
jgi:adenylate cyclase